MPSCLLVSIAGALLAVTIPAHGDPGVAGGTWTFTDVTAAAGIDHLHIIDDDHDPIQPRWIAGGAAGGDFDRDGFIDLYTVGGGQGQNRLWRNRGDGTFENVSAAAGVALPGLAGSGAIFADVDGDGWPDLLFFSPAAPEDGGLDDGSPRLLRNRGDGTFEDWTASCGLDRAERTYTAALGDYDRDGDLDLFTTHWDTQSDALLWRNTGAGHFEDATAEALGDLTANQLYYTFTPNFADIDGDGWPDLLVASDFNHSQVLRNRGDGTFARLTTAVISDENGMGASIGDYDNDGDLDWFVSSIWDESVGGGPWGDTGNRLYRNLGDGSFEDATNASGVHRGGWGWGSCFADFNNDGHLDLFHVNGWPAAAAALFHTDPAVLFIGRGDGTFDEGAAARGVADPGQGRGVVCFDYDRDGDLDLFIANNNQPPKLYRNDGGAQAGHYLGVTLYDTAANSQGVGARLYLQAGGREQLREIRLGANFVAHDPPEAHFGLGDAMTVDTLRVIWPDSAETTLTNLGTDQLLRIDSRCTLIAGGDGPGEDGFGGDGPDRNDPDGEVGQQRMVSAQVITNGQPAAGVTVAFTVLSGPHSGASGNVTTDAEGRAVFAFGDALSSGELMAASDHVQATALVSGAMLRCQTDVSSPLLTIFADGFESGDTAAWGS